MFVRILAANLIISGKVKVINEVDIKEVLEAADQMTLDDFVSDVLLRAGTYAKEFVLNLVPLALRININIHTVNYVPKDNRKPATKQLKDLLPAQNLRSKSKTNYSLVIPI